MAHRVVLGVDGPSGSVYPARTMGLFDFITNMFSPIDTKKLLEAAQGGVMQRATTELVGMAEDKAKEKLQEIAAEEVEKQIQAMLGDKANSVPQAVKDPIVEKTTEKVVESSWDSVKERISQRA